MSPSGPRRRRPLPADCGAKTALTISAESPMTATCPRRHRDFTQAIKLPDPLPVRQVAVPKFDQTASVACDCRGPASASTRHSPAERSHCGRTYTRSGSLFVDETSSIASIRMAANLRQRAEIAILRDLSSMQDSSRPRCPSRFRKTRRDFDRGAERLLTETLFLDQSEACARRTEPGSIEAGIVGNRGQQLSGRLLVTIGGLGGSGAKQRRSRISAPARSDRQRPGELAKLGAFPAQVRPELIGTCEARHVVDQPQIGLAGHG